MSARLLHSACLAALLVASGCTIQPPVGKLRCTVDSDCPASWSCVGVASGVGRCALEYSASVQDATTPGENRLTPEAGTPSDASEPAPHTDGEANAERDAGRPDTGANTPDAGAPDAASPDAGAPDAGAPSCEAAAPDEAQGVFVSPVQSSTLANCGSRSQPCATIALGIAQAARYARSRVYVDAGEYAENKLHLVAGVSVIGGWDNLGGSWTRSCREGREGSVVLVSADATAVEAEYDGEATLETLTIRTREATPASGESVYGIMARGERTRLRLQQVDVISASAAAGSPGADGDSPAAASGSCAGGSGSAGASASTPGVGAGLGLFGEQGYGAAHATAGSAGEPGAEGVPAVIACFSCVAALNAAFPQFSSCAGTLCFSQYIPTMSCPPTPGTPGCGGAAGGGGTPGGSGGSSVALFVWNAQVDLQDVGLVAKRGGTGAVGGLGGIGAPGSAGVAGAAGPTCNSVLRIMGTSMTSGPSVPGAPALVSGPGGRGGDGSAAGSGAGGSSFALVHGPTATITGLESCELVHAEAGLSDGNGASGQAGEILAL